MGEISSLIKFVMVSSVIWSGMLTCALGQGVLMLREITLNSRGDRNGHPYGMAESVGQIIVVSGALQIIIGIIAALIFIFG